MLLREETFEMGTTARETGDVVMVMVALSEALTILGTCDKLMKNPYKLWN